MGLCVLLTSVGGLVTPGIIENLRNIPEVSRIIGVDASTEAIGFYLVDKDYMVPKGDTAGYVGVISEIAETENVDVIIPCSDEEVLALSRHKTLFKEKGVAIFCSDYETTSKAIDKGSMLTFLKQRNFSIPQFFLPTTTTELSQAAIKLGYPNKPVVVKPRRGRGGRGFRLLTENVDVLHTRNSKGLRLEWFIQVAKQHEPLQVVLMEYLPGEDYSVDALVDYGRLLFIVPRKRINAIQGPSQLGDVFWNQEVVDAVKLIAKEFKFNSNVNIQLKYSAPPNEAALVYEINPRVSGTIVAGTAAGVDLLSYGIKYALGLDLPANIMPRSIRMIRYFKEYFYDCERKQ